MTLLRADNRHRADLIASACQISPGLIIQLNLTTTLAHILLLNQPCTSLTHIPRLIKGRDTSPMTAETQNDNFLQRTQHRGFPVAVRCGNITR